MGIKNSTFRGLLMGSELVLSVVIRLSGVDSGELSSNSIIPVYRLRAAD